MVAFSTIQTTYNAALYCRLSRDDGSMTESSSIATQKELLARYARENGITNTEYYIDDGWSGTNFDRPDFQRMLADIEDGRINCVITKDLSRLGRNYIDTGIYMEVYFPEHNVRYIAINDSVDTAQQGTTDFTPFRNMMNDLYAQDTSKKVKSAKRSRVLSGMYVATSAPYGYRKDDGDRHRLLIDERYAPTVRMIFDLALEGKGISTIRSYLNTQHILRPSAVNPNGYGRFFDGEDDARRYEWSNNSVRGILRNPVYAGHLVMGKRIAPSFRSHKRKCVLPENYTVVRNVHEPIVEPSDFELVQKLITSRRSTQTQQKPFENIFAGLLKCEDCGYAMTLAKAHRSPKEELIDEYGYMCSNYKTFGKAVDTSHWIEARALYESVLADIRRHAEEALADNDAMVERLVLRADKAHGDITERNYQMMCGRYETELERQIKELEEQSRNKTEDEQNAEHFAKLIRSYAEIDKLTAPLLNALIEKITVGEAKGEKGQRTQEIKIFYKFIGQIS